MNTLNLNELAAVCGGVDPLTDLSPPQSNWSLFGNMDQIAREQEHAFLRGMIVESAD
jgi:hypothetical protein